MMNNHKEREAFEEVFPCSTGTVLNEYGHYESQVYQQDAMIQNISWVVWRAAKAQAVPEGFILVRREPDADLVNHGHQVFLGHFNEGGQTGGRSLYFAYKAMIEAQEPAND